MREEKIIEMLKEEGIEGSIVENPRGTGIALGDGNVKPTIYLKYLEDLTDEQIVNKAKTILEHSQDNNIESQVKEIFTIEGLKKNLILDIQPKSDQEILKRAWNDLELTMKALVNVDNGNGFIKIRQEVLDKVGMDADEAWKIAEENTCEKTTIENLDDMLFEFTGNLIKTGLYYLSTEYESAAAVVNKDALKSYCMGMKLKRMYLIPSSRHEIIMAPEIIDIEAMGNMIREGNQNEVEEEDRLSDHVYIYDLDKDEITY